MASGTIRSAAQSPPPITLPARCSSEPPGITLREMKDSYLAGNRVMSLLVLESAATRSFAHSAWEDERKENSYDRVEQNRISDSV